MLEPAPHETPLTTEEGDQEGDGEYKVEEILDSEEQELGGIKYLVKWVGYPPEDNTWEPIKNLTYYNIQL